MCLIFILFLYYKKVPILYVEEPVFDNKRSIDMVLNKAHFQDLANIRYEEAKILLDNGKYDGAYYLSGYVIEFALKACFAKNVNQYDYPDKDIIFKLYSHGLKQLLGLASLTAEFDKEIKINPQLDINWSNEVVKWTSESRYSKCDKLTAQKMFNAISSPNGGVFTWLKKHW
jgi:HEPN domain-containing protein